MSVHFGVNVWKFLEKALFKMFVEKLLYDTFRELENNVLMRLLFLHSEIKIEIIIIWEITSTPMLWGL